MLRADGNRLLVRGGNGANGFRASTARALAVFAERQVGIGSAAMAIERHMRAQSNLLWTDVTYLRPGGLIERLPLSPRLTGTFRGFLQTGEALRQGPFGALLFLTHNPAVLHQHAITRVPTLLWTDVTPTLLDNQAHHYDHSIDQLRALRAIKKALVRRAFQRAALCIGWSDWARRSFVRDYDVAEDRTLVVPPGIDLDHWVRPEHRADERLPRLLFVGGNFVRKGGELLLRVFREHLRGRCTLDLVTRDAVPEEEGVRVHRDLTPTSPELMALYRTASAFVLPTFGDCYSIASIEAMAMGLPVIVSDVGGIREIVEPGRSGYLMQPGDGRELKGRLEALISDLPLRHALGDRGRELVEARFDAKKTAERLLALLAGAASGVLPEHEDAQLYAAAAQ